MYKRDGVETKERGDERRTASPRRRRDDLLAALQQEYAENDLFPATDITEDWLKLIDYDPENVVKISPVRPLSDSRARASSGVI